MTLFRDAWRSKNGLRRLGLWSLVAGVSVGVAFMVTLGAIVATLFDPGPFAPVTYQVPQRILNDPVPLGVPVEVERVRCNNSDETISVLGSLSWVQSEPVSRVIGSELRTAPIVPGCTTSPIANPMPAGVSPGTWHLEGVIFVVDGEHTQILSWYTEKFEVVE